MLFLPLIVVTYLVSTAAGKQSDHAVIILGGGVAGIIAARSLKQQGIDDFLIVEARSELGGRLHSTLFGAPGKQKTIELGANWVQGTQTGRGLANPIWELTKKHKVQTVNNDWNNISTSPFVRLFFTRILTSHLCFEATYDSTGQVDYLGIFDNSTDAYTELTVGAGQACSQFSNGLY
jgi:polyamine oxidase